MTKTVKVRVAVAVAPNGTWTSVGSSGLEEGTAASIATDYDDRARLYWLTAEVELPEETEIEASVSPC